MAASEASPRLKQFFYWRVRRAFQDLGLRGPETADYISSALARFAVAENLWRLEGQGARLVPGTVVETLAAAHEAALAGQVEAARDIRQHEADYILFTAGLFRRYLERQRFFDFYLEQGRRDYRFVFEFERVRFRTGATLYLELADGLNEYVEALNHMSQVFFRDRAGESFAALRVELDRLS